MTTLYRKYRPQLFSSVVGQEHVVTTLQNEIGLNQLAQAYLLAGPRGTGKTSLARLLAKAVNCAQRPTGSPEPCNECASCRGIAEQKSLDVMEIDAASQTGVDNVRENIIEATRFQPAAAPYKIFIIDEVHMLSLSSFNALLKIIEEPPAHVIFILATTEPSKLPATIISRCQRFNFKKIPYPLMRERLKKITAEEKLELAPEVFDRLILKSEGCLRDAESLLGQIAALSLPKVEAEDIAWLLPLPNTATVLTYLEKIRANDLPAAFAVLNELVNDGQNLEQFARSVIELLRTTLRYKATRAFDETATLEYTAEDKTRIEQLASTFADHDLVDWLDRALVRREQIRSAPLPQLPLELLAVELGQPAITNTPSDNLAKSARHLATKPASTLTTKATSANDSAASPTEPPAPAPGGLGTSIKSALSHLRKHRPLTTSLETVQSRWDEAVNVVGASSHSLTFILKMCQPVLVENDELHISVPYAFHKEKLEANKSRQVIATAFEQVFGEKITLVYQTQPGDTSPGGVAVGTVAQLATEFGGEVVN